MFSKKAYVALLLIIYGFESVACWPVMPVGGLSSNYIVSNIAVTWKEAFLLCKQYGMELVSITSAEEHNAVAEVVASHPMRPGGANGFWTAATRYGSGNSFAWFTTGKPVMYSKFAPGQPDNSQNNEECVEYFKENDSSKSYLWNDIDCNHKAPGYICQHHITPC